MTAASGSRGLDNVQAENGALQGLVVDLAANKAEAKKRLQDLREKYQHLLQVLLHSPLHSQAPSGCLWHPPRSGRKQSAI